MRQVTMAVSNLARQLLAHEADQSQHPEDIAGAAERACAKLRLQLVRLVGIEGFLALLSRALTLAKTGVPWLTDVAVMPDGSLEGLQKAAPAQDKDGAAEGYVTFLGHILGLLALFIGEALARRLLCEVWPEMTQNGTTTGFMEETER